MYRLVDTEIWDDAWYSELAPEAKFLFMWFLTNRRTNSVGAYEITLRQVAFETGLKSDMIERLLLTLHPKVQWWPEHSIVWVRNFYGRQNNGEKIEINAKRIVAELPPEIRDAVGKAYPALSYKEDTPCITHAYPMHKQNSNVTEQDVTETETEHTPPESPRGDRVSMPEFDHFWFDVLRKEPSRGKAYEAYCKARKKASAEDIHEGLKRWLPAWAALDDKTKVPHITTWLNQERWTVEMPVGVPRAGPNGTAPRQQTPEEIAEFKAWMKENQPA